MSKAAAASTIPQTNTTRQENTGKSVTIFVILAPAVTHLDDPARALGHGEATPHGLAIILSHSRSTLG